MLGYDFSLKTIKIIGLHFTHKIKTMYSYSRLALYFENNIGTKPNSLEVRFKPFEAFRDFFLIIVVINILVRGPTWLLPQILTI